eukprot:SAG11_NODE_6209_length_1364_cov_0.692490_1_plen_385_part_10
MASPRYVGCYTDVETWTDSPDLPVRRQMGAGMTCSTLVEVLGCAADMHDINLAVPAGSLVSALCPLSCNSCPQAMVVAECEDDPDGSLPFPCEDVVAQVGCAGDMHELDDAIPVGTPLSTFCPVTCDTCPEPPACVDDPGGLVSAAAPASHQTCAALCDGFVYMGVQAADKCFCGNAYGKYACPDVVPPPVCADDPNGLLPMACPGILQQGLLSCDFDLSSIDTQFTETMLVSSICPETCGMCNLCADDPDAMLPMPCDDVIDAVPGGCNQDLHEVDAAFEQGLLLSTVCANTCGSCVDETAAPEDICKDPDDSQCGTAGAECGNGDGTSEYQCFESITVLIRLPLALNDEGVTRTDATETSWNIDGGPAVLHHKTGANRHKICL